MILKCFRAFSLLVFLSLGGITLNAKEYGDSVIKVKIDLAQKKQTIENIGSSGCWFSEGIGKDWPKEKKERIAQLLFSRQFDKNGKAEGIGLSAWRFNIGAGTTEQGDSSGIKDFRKRSESFLKKDGTYDWTKQAGYQFFLQKAHDYGVETLIAFSNSPPVQFTKNGLGYKTEKNYESNLREDAFEAYATFLSTVVKHFDQQGLHFEYVSPVNEPQWDWSHKYKEADQEGSPWSNYEIYKVTKALNTALVKDKLSSKILLTEAGMLNYLCGGSGKAGRQIQTFFNRNNPLYVADLPLVPKIIAGHSYFTESNNEVLASTRKQLADTVKAYGLNYWQSEYSMLADGFKEGTKGDRSAMDCALFLSKVIHSDLTVGNATAWQFWNAYEPGSAARNTRYYLIALQPNEDYKDGEFTVTKNLWALGHYSRFVRPGMTRLSTEMLTGSKKEHKDIMISAFTNQSGKMIVVCTNYGSKKAQLELDIKNVIKKYGIMSSYLTTEEQGIDLKKQPVQDPSEAITLPARSITTIVLD
ncbi:beta-glycosidase [Pedobacter sp. MC2016-14]|uniref:glycoside hydrolase n=1 Tax=Pedobacter sp. MC2016-14 TaxID=2897327 RepID=UPI001E433859|nr:glycoside hydrolase [Pedobacter sp. MC2016-14]MCD0489501.1 beta-glycosidase [Pedobacter sp. MC2016-14]